MLTLKKKEIVVKICLASKLKNLKNKNFKLVIKGEISLELLNSFVSLDINRDGNALKLINYEVIEKDLSENNSNERLIFTAILPVKKF